MRAIVKFFREHPLTRDDLPRALFRFARYQLLTRTRAEVAMPWIEGTRLVVRRHTPGASGNLYTGLHEYADMGFLLHFLRGDDLFADVGANVGTWTVLASGVCRARSVAFEPDPQTFEYLRRTVEANALGDLVRIEQLAVGAENGTVSFTIGKDTENRIARPGDAATREVKVRRLDDLLDRAPTFLKMDVEGFEEGVVEGAGALLSDPALQAVSTELCTPAIEAALAKAGLSRAWYDPQARRLGREPNGLWSNNSLFVRDLDRAAARVAEAPRRRIFNRSL